MWTCKICRGRKNLNHGNVRSTPRMEVDARRSRASAVERERRIETSKASANASGCCQSALHNRVLLVDLRSHPNVSPNWLCFIYSANGGRLSITSLKMAEKFRFLGFQNWKSKKYHIELVINFPVLVETGSKDRDRSHARNLVKIP